MLLPDGYAMLIRHNEAETAVHGCYCPGDMAVRMHKVLARPRVGVRECHLLFVVVLTSCRPAVCGVKMRDPENEVADFRSVNMSGVVKHQSSQVTSHDLAIAVRLLLQSMTSSCCCFVCFVCFVINHFTVVCSVTWPLNGSEAAGDLLLIQTSLLLLYKSGCYNAN